MVLLGTNNKMRNGWNLKENLTKLELNLETKELDFIQNRAELTQIHEWQNLKLTQTIT